MIFRTYGRDGEERVSDLKGILSGPAGRVPTAFLVGGAPSLRGQPYGLLSQAGVLSFSMNNAGRLFRPTHLVASDEGRCIDSRLLLDPSVVKFMWSAHAMKPVRPSGPLAVPLRDMPSVLFFDADVRRRDSSLLHESLRLDWKRNTLFLGISVMHHLGIRRIVLAGSDFEAGTGSASYASGPGLTPDEAAWNETLYRFEVADLVKLRPVFDDAGLEIVDTSAGSKICRPLGPYRHATMEEGVQMCLEGFPPSFDDPSSLPHCSSLHRPELMQSVLANRRVIADDSTAYGDGRPSPAEAASAAPAGPWSSSTASPDLPFAGPFGVVPSSRDGVQYGPASPSGEGSEQNPVPL